jgi:hypothetical protein
MNAPHLHLVLAHLPVVGSLGAALLLAVALLRVASHVRRIALCAMLLVALTGPLAYLTGEGAEEAIEGNPVVEETRIERHEDMAKVALGGLGLAGMIALAGLVALRRRAIPGSLLVVLLAVDLGAIVLMSKAATLGGEISHPEIRSGAGPPPLAGEIED